MTGTQAVTLKLSDEQKQVVIRDQILEWEAAKLKLELQIEGAVAAAGSDASVSDLRLQIEGFNRAITKVSHRLNEEPLPGQ